MVAEKVSSGSLTWHQCILGFGEKKVNITQNTCKIYNPNDVYEFGDNITKLRENAGIVTYLDVQEEEGALIAKESISPLTTHVEIHPSLILGIHGKYDCFS